MKSESRYCFNHHFLEMDGRVGLYLAKPSIEIPGENDEFWQQVEEKFWQECLKYQELLIILINFINGKLPPLWWDNSAQDHLSFSFSKPEIFKMISGSLNLLNLLIEMNDQGSAVDVMVGLDKSQRNGMYLLYQLVNDLKAVGFLAKSFKLPRIIFLNPDKNQQLTDDEIEELKHQIHWDSFLHNKILLVDDFTTSGETLTWTQQLIHKFEPKHKPPLVIGIAQFIDVPSWYLCQEIGLLGVLDDYESNSHKQLLISKPLSTPEQKQALFIYRFLLSVLVDSYITVSRS